MKTERNREEHAQRFCRAASVSLALTAALLFSSSKCSIAAQQHSPPAGFATLAKQADAARDAQQLDKAVPLYRKALALNPRWTEGWWSLGTIYYDGDRYASAADAFQHLARLDPKQGTARAMLGLCEFELGDSAGALRDIEASKGLGVLEDEQLRQVVFYHEGLLLQRAGRFYAAQRALASLCLGGVKSEELTLTLGLVVLRMRDERPPAPGTADGEVVEHLGRGACLEAAKNYDQARPEFESVVAKHPDYPSIHYAYGRFLLDDGDRDAAIREFQLQIEADPGDVLSRLLIGATEIRVDDAAGLPYAEESVRMAPSSPLAHFVLGALLLDAGKDQEAISHLEIARKAFPAEQRLLWSLASAYARVGRMQDAAQTRAAYLRVHSESSDAGSADAPVEITDKMPAPQP